MKKRKTVIRYLSKHIDKTIIALSYILLFFMLLALVPGILYQEKLVQMGIWQGTREIKNDSFIIRYHLNTGDNKPAVLTIDGDELLAVDGWESTVNVNNSSRSMWDHTFRNVVPESKKFVIHDVAWDNYELRQTATLHEDQVTFEYEFLSMENQDISPVLSLYHRYGDYSTLTFDNVKINENQENILLTRYAVKLELDETFAAAENVRYERDNASYWIHLTFYSSNIPADNYWHPVAKLIMSYSTMEREQSQG